MHVIDWSRSRSGDGSGVTSFKKLGAGLEPESDFKVVFKVEVIVGSKISNYFCILDIEYQNM